MRANVLLLVTLAACGGDGTRLSPDAAGTPDATPGPDAGADASTTAGCGNQLTEPGEECDDGNQNDLDTCTHLCTVRSCGDDVAGPHEICFASSDAWFSSAAPSALALGDLDHDDDLDVVVGYGDGAVTVFLNDGTGKLEIDRVAATGGAVSDLALARVDGDDFPDLVVAHFNLDNVVVGITSVSAQPPPDRISFTFGAPLATDGPIALALADLDGANGVDILTASLFGPSTNKVCVLAGNGSGGFLAPACVATGGVGPLALAVGNLDGDTDLDVIVGNSITDDTSVLLNNAGVLSAQPTVPTGDFTWGVAIGDFDGNGQGDLAAVAHYPGQLVLRRTAPAAPWPISETLPVGSLPKAVATGQISPDGLADVVAAAANGLYVRLHTPTGVVAGTIPLGSGLRRVALGDLDGDLIADIVVIDETAKMMVALLSNP